MKNKTQTRTEQFLIVMNILAWVAFVGFAIEAGAVLVSYAISCANPEAAKHLYRELNLYDLRQFNFWYYSLYVAFMVVLSIMRSWISFLVIKILSKFSLRDPFTMEVVRRLEKISYFAFAIWVVTMLSNAYTSWLIKISGKLYGNQISGEFIFMVGLVFIIAQVFKHGVEIQSENDLTV
jgi:Protein of unknown function (DUF2975)